MSEPKRNSTYGSEHKASVIAVELKAEKEASKDNKLPRGKMKKRLVEAGLISNVSTTKLKGDEKRLYKYVSSIVVGQETVAVPCTTNREATLQRTRLRDKSDMKTKKVVDAPGADDGGWS